MLYDNKTKKSITKLIEFKVEMKSTKISINFNDSYKNYQLIVIRAIFVFNCREWNNCRH